MSGISEGMPLPDEALGKMPARWTRAGWADRNLYLSRTERPFMGLLLVHRASSISNGTWGCCVA